VKARTLALLSLLALVAGGTGLVLQLTGGALETASASSAPPGPLEPTIWPALLAVAVLGAAAVALRLRPAAPPAACPSLRVLQSLSIGPNQRLLAVRFGRRALLVGHSSAGLAVLSETSEAEELRELESGAAAEDFSGLWRRLFPELAQRA
jgi:hypothetical protein